MNIPNFLTILRILLIPLFLYFVFIPEVNTRIWALVVFVVAALTDLLDGWSARKLKQETEAGKFLDPLADKVLVISGLIAFLILDPLIPLWMVLIIVLRDILLTLMRYIAIKRNTTLKTTKFGKVKTFFQMISIIIIIMVLIYRSSLGIIYHEFATETFLKISEVYDILISKRTDKFLLITPYCLMAIVTLLTAFSGVRYIVTNRSLFLPKTHKKEDKNIK